MIYAFMVKCDYQRVLTHNVKEKVIMANRFILNETSYHGAGAVKEIAGEAYRTRTYEGICMLGS